jgi:hypothetical protein
VETTSDIRKEKGAPMDNILKERKEERKKKLTAL